MQQLEFKMKSQESDCNTGEATEPEDWKQEESSLSAVHGTGGHGEKLLVAQMQGHNFVRSLLKLRNTYLDCLAD